MVSITSNLRWVRRVRKGLASLGENQSAVDRVSCGVLRSSDVCSRWESPRRPLGPEYADVFARNAAFLLGSYGMPSSLPDLGPQTRVRALHRSV